MKHSQSSIFNSSEKTYYNFLKTGFSVINQNTSTPKKFNNSLTNIKFPKLILKSRNINLLKNKKNITQYSNISSYSNNISKKSFKDSLNILNFMKKNDLSNKILPNLRYSNNNNNKNNDKENEIKNPNRSCALLYNNYQNIKNKANNYFNYYDSIFTVKIKKTDYRKSLSSDYEKDNRHVIDLMTTKYKHKNESILNVVENIDGFYIKGLQYKKYYFFPHKKMNILAFHQNIMNNNLHHIKERRKMEKESKRRNDEKNYRNRNKRTSCILNNDKFLEENIFNRNRKRHWTKNYIIRRKMKQKIEDVVDDEINNVLASQKNK